MLRVTLSYVMVCMGLLVGCSYLGGMSGEKQYRQARVLQPLQIPDDLVATTQRENLYPIADGPLLSGDGQAISDYPPQFANIDSRVEEAPPTQKAKD